MGREREREANSLFNDKSDMCLSKWAKRPREDSDPQRLSTGSHLRRWAMLGAET